MLDKPNFHVLTGGPGVGKTTLLRALQAQGELCVEETARAVIREQLETGGRAVPWIDAEAFADATASGTSPSSTAWRASPAGSSSTAQFSTAGAPTASPPAHC